MRNVLRNPQNSPTCHPQSVMKGLSHCFHNPSIGSRYSGLSEGVSGWSDEENADFTAELTACRLEDLPTLTEDSMKGKDQFYFKFYCLQNYKTVTKYKAFKDIFYLQLMPPPHSQHM